MRRIATWRVLAAALLVAGGASLAVGGAFEDLAATDATPEQLAKRLAADAGRLTRGTDKVRGMHIVYCSPSERYRDRRPDEIDAMLDRGIEALAQAGFTSERSLPETIVVEVDVRGGFTGALEDPGGHAVLIRNGPEPPRSSSRGALPRLKERPDGPPIARDVLDAAARLRVELWSRAGGVTGDASSVHDLMARRLLRWAGPDEDAPEWLRVGLSGWLASRMSQEPLPEPDHVCGGAQGSRLAAILDPARTKPDVAAGHLARLVDLLITRDVDVAVGAGVLASAGEITDAAFTEAFGVPAAEVAAYVFPETEGEAGCAEGMLDCPLCAGAGEVEIACPDCQGTSAVGCTSCFGSSGCNGSGCIDGYHYYETGDKERCGYCGGSGTVKCKACRGKGATGCKACRRGVTTRDCPGCEQGRIPCPDSGGGEAVARACGETGDAPCPWCAPKDLERYCPDCGGAGYEGCFSCFGTQRALCFGCGGSGAQIMVYEDGTKASSKKCPSCSGKGYSRCDDCDGGKKACRCRGDGTQPMTPDDCPLCEGTAELPDVATSIARRRTRLAPPTPEEGQGIRDAIDKGVAYLMRCRSGDSFTLVHTRGSQRGRLMRPSLYSNATSIWTLSAVGITKDDPRMKGPYQALRSQAFDLVSDTPEYVTTQTAAEALRALIGAGAAPDDETVEGLVDLLVKGQKSDGLWSSQLDDKEDGEAYSGLFAIESLWLAQRRGAKVPRSTFSKAFRAGVRQFGSRGFDRDDYVTGTKVCSAVALVVIAKAGSLGKDAGTFDYMSLDAVQDGLAWLDRYMDIRDEPTISNGAYIRRSSQRGYAAYLYAVQRLSMLLSIEILGGERWYATGARHLVDGQESDGKWTEGSRNPLNGPVRTTTSALLFLARATPAVTDTGD